MKRGMISPVFKYIFVMIAGALILTFFVFFAMNMSGTGNKRIYVEVIETIEDSLNAYSVSASSYKILNTGSNNEINIRSGVIRIEEVSRKNKQIIFAPEKLKGSKFNLWTQRFYYPYAIVNFFYLTNLNDKYYLVYDQSTQDYVEELESKIHGLPNFELINLRDVGKIEGGNVVFFTSKRVVPNAKILTVDVGKKQIEFEDGSSTYLEDYMLIGGIVCGNKNSYDYLKEEVIDRIHKISNIYYYKTSFTPEPGCDYRTLKNQLGVMIKTPNLEQLENTKELLETSNNRLQGEGCNAIF